MRQQNPNQEHSWMRQYAGQGGCRSTGVGATSEGGLRLWPEKSLRREYFERCNGKGG